MGLQWGDIDTQASTIRIERSVSYTPQSGVVVNTPKTANSVRTIPILPSITSEKQSRKKMQKVVK